MLHLVNLMKYEIVLQEFIRVNNNKVMYLVVVVSSLIMRIEKSCMNYSSTVLPIAPFPVLGAFAKLRKATISFVMSVRPHGTTRLPLDGFS